MWHNGGAKVKFQALCEVVVELALSLDHVGGRPRLGEDDALCRVRILGFDIAIDIWRLGVLTTKDLEDDAGRSFGLDFKRYCRGKVLGQQVIGGLPDVLQPWKCQSTHVCERCCGQSTLPSMKAELAGAVTSRTRGD